MKYKVFVACKLSDIGLKKLKAQKALNVVVNPKPTIPELINTIADANAIIIKSNVKLTSEILDKANSLKVIVRAGAGVDNVDLKKATEKGIPVCNTPGLNSNSVAEQVFAYVHTLYKNMITYDATTKAGEWNKGKFPINELRGKTIGIGGLGAIGRRVLEKAHGYHMQAKVYDPFISNAMASDLGCKLVTNLGQLFKTCDIVSLHMPATPETKGKITADVLKSMKPGAIFINTARGTLLPPNALEDALAGHPTLRAAVDVYLEEGAGEKALSKFGERVVMTPHICGNSLEGQLEIAELCADLVIDALTKDKLRNLVNFVKIPEDLGQSSLDLAEALGRTASALMQDAGQLEEIRITCYGRLRPNSELLTKPAIKGVLSTLLPENITLINAESKAREIGTKITIREPNNNKHYEDSITVDVVMREGKKTQEISVRGKLIEGEPAIIRVGDYHELRMKPVGSNIFFVYDNKPGAIGCIATVLGENGINIEGILAREDSSTAKKQMLVTKTQELIDSALLGKICKKLEAKTKAKVYMAKSISFG